MKFSDDSVSDSRGRHIDGYHVLACIEVVLLGFEEKFSENLMVACEHPVQGDQGMFTSVPERDSLNAQCLLCLPWTVVDLVSSDADVVILVPEIVRRVERG